MTSEGYNASVYRLRSIVVFGTALDGSLDTLNGGVM